MLAEIDAVVGGRIEADGPGVAVAVVRGGEVVHAKGYGLANLEWEQPIAPDTVLCLGSLTKPFTAQAILLLERDGKLRLDDAITAYLPDFPTGDRLITVENLLTHTSGIANYVTQPGFWEHVAQTDRTPAELTDLFRALPPVFAPGERYSYSNSGYVLLGRIIEAVSRMPWDTFVRERIFAPLGMAHSRYMLHTPVIPRRARGYERMSAGWEHAPRFSMTLPYAPGGLGSTLDDLIRWDRALRDGRLLDRRTLEQTWRPLRLNDGRTEGYGLGWGLSDFRGRRVVHHAGGVPGFSSFYGRFIKDDLAILALSNIAGFDAAGLARDICDAALGMPAPPRQRISFDTAALDRFTGTYSDAITTFEVVAEGDALALRGEFDYQLFQTGAATFAAMGDPDVELRFADNGGTRCNRVKLIVPFYWVSAYRVQEQRA